jgi:hypothetical protein
VTFIPRICPRALAVFLATPDDLHGGSLLVEVEVEAAIYGGEDTHFVGGHLGFPDELAPTFDERNPFTPPSQLDVVLIVFPQICGILAARSSSACTS